VFLQAHRHAAWLLGVVDVAQMMRPVDPLKANPTLRFPTDALGYWQFAGVRPAAQVCQNVLSVPVRRQTLGLRMAEGDTVCPSLLSFLSRTRPRLLSVRVSNHPTPCAWPTRCVGHA